jgi:hypothetical protein
MIVNSACLAIIYDFDRLNSIKHIQRTPWNFRNHSQPAIDRHISSNRNFADFFSGPRYFPSTLCSTGLVSAALVLGGVLTS